MLKILDMKWITRERPKIDRIARTDGKQGVHREGIEIVPVKVTAELRFKWVAVGKKDGAPIRMQGYGKKKRGQYNNP